MTSRLIVIIIVCTLVACASPTPQKFGVQDDFTAAAIRRANLIVSLRRAGDYSALAKLLRADMDEKFATDSYARPRIMAELAEIYSLNLLDIEAAVNLDRRLQSEVVSDAASARTFLPIHGAANQIVLSDAGYVKQYLARTANLVMIDSRDRLARNEKLLTGEYAQSATEYPVVRLVGMRKVVLDDIRSTAPDSPEWRMLISRLYRIDLDLMKRGSPSESLAPATFNIYLPPLQVNLEEIDYLALSDYYALRFERSGDPQFARWALESIYGPYGQLREMDHRWRYSRLVNRAIERLIEHSYRSSDWNGFIYYTSLNKSRIVIEERLGLKRSVGNGNASVASLQNGSGIEVDRNGLPTKEWFDKKLASAGPFIEFYLGGAPSNGDSSSKLPSSVMERANSPLSTRDFGVEGDMAASTSSGDVLYVATRDASGQIKVTRVAGKELTAFKAEMSDSMGDIIHLKSLQPSKTLRKWADRLMGASQVKIFPDKWLSGHPLEYHLSRDDASRSLNLFLSSSKADLDRLDFAGFFNPTLDLPGADAEASVVKGLLVNPKVFVGSQASLEVLRALSSNNIVHFSMHGAFNPQNPLGSKLYFAGARRGLEQGDSNALYASQMSNIALLQDRDLIFAAACQTGVVGTESRNESELVGIMRPLISGGNRNVILSLWKVDDQATKEFVQWFYYELSKTRNVRSSFEFARSKVKAKFVHPYYWAAFFLAQNI